MKKFANDFIFGAATSAYQAEGAASKHGRGPCYWDEYLEQTKKFSPENASYFYDKYKEDVELCNTYGVNGIRVSISWSRIFPKGYGEINLEGVQFYHDLLKECIDKGVEPFVTLHHFDTPLDLYHDGDWLSDKMIDKYVEYCEYCFKEFKEVKHWITINEPWSLTAGQYLIGHFPPNIQYDLSKAVNAMDRMVYAHARVVNLYKSLNLGGEIGIIHILEPKEPISNKEGDIKAAKYEHTLCNTMMLESTLNGFYSDETLSIINDILSINNMPLFQPNDEYIDEFKEASKSIDFLGINYYQTHFVEAYDGESNIHHNGTGSKGSSIYALKGVGKHVLNPEVPTTDWDWSIYPQGLYNMLVEIKNKYHFDKPIYVTENGMGAKEDLKENTVHDEYRIEYIKGHLEAILKAIEEGVDVKGYFLWSLMDVFSWTNGFNKRYGLFYIDFENGKRYVKDSARWFKQISEKKELI